MTTKLIAGASYSAKQDGFTDSIDFGAGPEELIYPPQEKHFIVLPKPKRVIADDGETEIEIDTPEHLLQEDWYFVRYLNNGNCAWFNSTGWDSISQITVR